MQRTTEMNPSDGKQFLGDRVQTIGTSGIRRIFDLASTMPDPIDLSMGQPDFDTPLPLKEAAIAAIREGHNGYTVTHGLPALREAIARALRREFNWEPALLVTCGVSGGLVLSLMACLNPGDEVLMGDPYFVSYEHLVRLAGGTPVKISLYDDFQLHPQRFVDAVGDRTKAILLNSPANPTGAVHHPEDVESIAACARKHDLLLISDEIYNTLSYDGRSPSPVDYAPERTLLLRGFGKSFGMTGWRMGFAAGPSEIIAQMAKLQQFTFVCAPHPMQVGCIDAFDVDMTHVIDEYRQKRDLAYNALRDHFEIVRPSGGFYLFPQAPLTYASATEFVERAIAHNVLIIPGSVFSARDTHFRISYAASNDKLKRGCEILGELAT